MVHTLLVSDRVLRERWAETYRSNGFINRGENLDGRYWRVRDVGTSCASRLGGVHYERTLGEVAFDLRHSKREENELEGFE